MNIPILKNEIVNDTLGRGYAGMTDAEIAADLNTVYRTRNKTSVTGSEILNAVIPAAYTALDTTGKQLLWDIVHLGDINPFGIEATLLTQLFGAGSDTIIALAALRLENISRATELGLGRVRTYHVTKARS